MQCIAPVRLMKLDPVRYPDGLLVPCGKCLQCRIKKRSEWVLRITHEISQWKDTSFVTLTYNNDNLPYNDNAILPTLRKKDLQMFFKRLRSRINKIKYFACGEYGDVTQRPHYHMILCGVGLSDEHKLAVIESWNKCDWNVPEILQGSFGLAEPDSIRYVAQYIDKKLSGDDADVEYNQKLREPVFRLLSQGLGRDFALNARDQILQQQKITLRGITHSIPRYYLKKLDIDTDLIRSHAVEKEIELVESVTGKKLTRDEHYQQGCVDEILKLEQHIRDTNIQRDKNLSTKLNIKITKKL